MLSERDRALEFIAAQRIVFLHQHKALPVRCEGAKAAEPRRSSDHGSSERWWQCQHCLSRLGILCLCLFAAYLNLRTGHGRPCSGDSPTGGLISAPAGSSVFNKDIPSAAMIRDPLTARMMSSSSLSMPIPESIKASREIWWRMAHRDRLQPPAAASGDRSGEFYAISTAEAEAALDLMFDHLLSPTVQPRIESPAELWSAKAQELLSLLRRVRQASRSWLMAAALQPPMSRRKLLRAAAAPPLPEGHCADRSGADLLRNVSAAVAALGQASCGGEDPATAGLPFVLLRRMVSAALHLVSAAAEPHRAACQSAAAQVRQRGHFPTFRILS